MKVDFPDSPVPGNEQTKKKEKKNNKRFVSDKIWNQIDVRNNNSVCSYTNGQTEYRQGVIQFCHPWFK